MPPGEKVSFDDFLERVERVRQLAAKDAVFGLRVAEDDLILHVERSFKKELPEHALRGTEDMLVALGTVPHGFDFEQAMLDLLRSQLAGLYDPRKNAMFVRADLEGNELEATLLHELVHALQDQAYNLDEFSAYREDGTDRSSALSALAEGDATSAMYDGMLALLAERSGDPAQTALDLPLAQLTAGMEAAAEAPEGGGVPRIIRRSLIAPYRDGISFVHQLRRRGGWPEVDAAWKRPPETTEQMLHVDRYLDREVAISTPLVAAPEASWTKLLSDVWGEQSLRLVFEEVEPRAAAEKRAEGWGGDRIAIFARKDERALSWHLIADDAASAARYFDGFRLLARHGAASGANAVSGSGASFCQERSGVGPLSAALQGKHVIVLAGPYPHSPSGTSPATCEASRKWLTAALAQL